MEGKTTVKDRFPSLAIKSLHVAIHLHRDLEYLIFLKLLTFDRILNSIDI